MGLLDGFGVTIRKWLAPGSDTGRRVTTEYPEQTRPKPERFHGRHVLNRYPDGMEKCIGCELCAGVCPARCIYVRGADNDPDDPTSPGERYGYVYEINYLRCIHCDLCVEACPTEAITETKLFEFAFTNRSDAIYTKDELVVDDDGRPRQLPWENWEGGFDPAADTSGWMRATSPSGDADFVGIVAWAGELGYGVRAPEDGGTVEAEVAPDLPEEPPADRPVERPAGLFDAVAGTATQDAPAPTRDARAPAPTSDPTAAPAPALDAPDADEASPEATPLLVDVAPEDADAADDPGAADGAPEEPEQPGGRPAPPQAGFFDAPDEPEPPAKGRRGRRRKGGR